VAIKWGEMITAINPQILIWARERCRFSVEDIARSLGRDSDSIRQWESGEAFPSYTTLETLAYGYYKIPLAVFFFPEPPDIDDPAAKFRRLPDYELERLSSDTRQKILIAQAYQESLKELLQKPVASHLIWHEIKISIPSIPETASIVRNYLGMSLEQQFSFRKGDEAFKAWRNAIEQCGIYTFKDSFTDRFVSGFCLYHDEFPVIMVNNSNSFSRQIFTLLHELGHILLGVNGITDVDEDYFNFMNNGDRSLEIACNRFAAEVLVPSSSFLKDIAAFEAAGQEIISELAKKYSVSREVILRRLLDFGAIDQAYYTSKAVEWNNDYLRQSRGTAGGNWYLTKLSYLGEGFTRLAFENYRQGRISKPELAEHLNVKARNLERFESHIGW
jgi:Zn-dependent peptidase ImmA (M78 family)/transcriptional regulator with XRE-family HTH domain